MGKKRAHNTFLFVGNQLCLDFVNTQMIVRGQVTDLIEDVSALMAWLVEARVLTAHDATQRRGRWKGSDERRLMSNARAFREILRRMAERIVAGKPVQPQTVDAINRLLGLRPGYPQLARRDGRFERFFQSNSADAACLLTPLAEAASDLLCSGDLSLVKKCRNAACILYFYDTTKNHARQWCSMSLCGNRVKVATHYKRARTERA